ncbi:dephospho-CoA kinase [bacterium]|nr:dephospho-CoA kinase [bacterium]
MIRVGLTGGCCTGKSTVAEMFSRLGAEIVSADDIVHRLLREEGEIRSGVVSVFGEGVLARDGSIDRGKLAGLVFNDKQSLTSLTDLLYPRVKHEIKRLFAEVESRRAHEICVAEVPLLIEEGTLDLYDVILVVRSSYSNQLTRFLERGGTSREDLDRRIANQMDLSQKEKLANYVVDNDGSLEQTFQQVKDIYENLRLRRSRSRCDSSAVAGSGEVRGEVNKAKIKSER